LGNADWTCAKSKDKGAAADVFTPPPEMTAVPIFVDGAGDALQPYDATGADGSEPDLNPIKKLPSLTGLQRKSVDKMQTDFRLQKAALQDGIKSMKNQLKNLQTPSIKAKATKVIVTNEQAVLSPAPEKDSTMDMQQSESQQDSMMQEQVPEEEIKARIQSATQQMKDANKQLWNLLMSILTPGQQEELNMMRRGQLVITTSASPQSTLGTMSDTTSGAAACLKSEPVSKSIDKQALKRILSNHSAQQKRDKSSDFSGL